MQSVVNILGFKENSLKGEQDSANQADISYFGPPHLPQKTFGTASSSSSFFDKNNIPKTSISWFFFTFFLLKYSNLKRFFFKTFNLLMKFNKF